MYFKSRGEICLHSIHTLDLTVQDAADMQLKRSDGKLSSLCISAPHAYESRSRCGCEGDANVKCTFGHGDSRSLWPCLSLSEGGIWSLSLSLSTCPPAFPPAPASPAAAAAAAGGGGDAVRLAIGEFGKTRSQEDDDRLHICTSVFFPLPQVNLYSTACARGRER